jgi:two-component system cell cycle sensor histidine kinase/response regulator CckA
VVEKETDALIADQARRASAARAIVSVFVVLTFVGSVPSVLLGRSWTTALIQLAASACLAAIWWRSSRQRLSATQTGLGLVIVVLLEVMLSAIMASRPSDAVQISYLISLTPFLAAITLRARGVILTVLGGALALASIVAVHGSAGDWHPFVSNFFYFAAAATAAIFGSLASERALLALTQEGARTKAARARARSAEARYQLVSEHVSDLVSVHDEEGRFVYVSPAHQRVLGIDPEGLLGKTTTEFVHPDDLPLLSASFRKALVEGKGAAVTRIRMAEGGYRWFHVGMSRVDQEEGQGGVIALSARDITEQRELSEALEATRRMESLGRLAGGVAHDFNNLLMVIQSASDLASSQLPNDHPAQVDLSDVRRAAERASALTQQLLTFARRQVLPSDSSSVVSKVVRDLVPILTRLCGPDILFEAQIESPRREVEASPVQLEQLLMNLCANARDAMPNGGRLGLRVRDRTLASSELADLKPGPYVEITVEDTGVGMTPEVQARMFEPFFTTKPVGRGTGLGLATVFGLVSQLGGNISVRSELGRGTTFTILLPEALGWPAHESSKVGKVADFGESLDVLVVEDEDAVRALVVRILNNAGHRVVEASSIEEAIEAAKAPGAEFNAVVTDVVLGSGDGISALERITSLHPKAAVVVVSGFSPSPERVAALSARGAEFLAKPFGAAALIGALANARARRTGSSS